MLIRYEITFPESATNKTSPVELTCFVLLGYKIICGTNL